MTRNPWAWLLTGLILGFLAGAMYGLKKNLKPRLRQLDGTTSLRRPAARPPSIFDGSVGWDDPFTGKRVLGDRGWREAR